VELKVVTLNIWEGLFLDKAINFLKEEDADILLLQEVYGQNATDSKDQFRTLEILQESLELPYYYYTPGLRHRREEGMFLEGNAIFSRFPILRSDAVFFQWPI
jgi:endonuclease/exonuclease/phosphatase family metal-dependent hydrolase